MVTVQYPTPAFPVRLPPMPAHAPKPVGPVPLAELLTIAAAVLDAHAAGDCSTADLPWTFTPADGARIRATATALAALAEVSR